MHNQEQYLQSYDAKAHGEEQKSEMLLEQDKH